jgi:hypothetical protein
MTRVVYSIWMLLALQASLLAAREAPGPSSKEPKNSDFEAINSPPKRQIQFEHKEESFGPGQLEPVVAIVRLNRTGDESEAIPSSELVGWNSTQVAEVEKLRHRRLEGGVGQRAFFPGRAGSLFDRNPIPRSLFQKSVSEYFSTVLRAIPKEVQPEPLVREFFVSENVDKGFLQVKGRQEDNESGTIEFQIMARDKASAEKLAAGLLHILDWGVSRPIQLSLWEERELWDREITRIQSEQERTRKELAETQTKLDESKDFSSESLTDLRTQQRLLQVDIAGAKARGEACDLLLNKGGLSADRSDQILNLKITAEIDLAGLIAKKGVLDELVSATNNKKSLESSLRTKQRELDSFDNPLNLAKRYQKLIQGGIKKFGPLPLVDGKITIVSRT